MTNSFSRCGFVKIWFKQIIVVLWQSVQILFQDRQGATKGKGAWIRLGGGGGGGRGVSPYTVVLVLQTENYGSLHVYFVVQIPLFID